jgi:hypothetical protein
MKSTTDKKERTAYSNSGWCCRWEKMKTMMRMMSENQLSQSKVYVTAFWGTEGLAPKSWFK